MIDVVMGYKDWAAGHLIFQQTAANL